MISESARQAGAWIRTASGLQFDLIHPEPEFVVLEDVIHSLARLNRFTGHGTRFYSVAEHSIAVARRVRELGGSPEVVRQALLHDAAEAYVGDVSSPLKRAMRHVWGDVQSDYDRIEGRVWHRAIAPRFGLAPELDGLVRRADHELAEVEGASLIPGWCGSTELVGSVYEPRCWAPDQAHHAFAHALARAGVS